MAKIQIKSEKITPFGGIFPIMDEFNRVLSGIVDSTLGFRCKLFGYQYSEIIRSLMCGYFCGGTCIEDLSKHLIPFVSQLPKLRIFVSQTYILVSVAIDSNANVVALVLVVKWSD